MAKGEMDMDMNMEWCNDMLHTVVAVVRILVYYALTFNIFKCLIKSMHRVFKMVICTY